LPSLNSSIAIKWIAVGLRAPRVAISMIFSATVSVARSDLVLRPSAQTLTDEGVQLAADLALYGEVAPKLVDVFSRLAAYRQKLSALYADRPPGVDDIPDPELEARNLQHFARDCPTLLDSVQLRDWHSGREVWPERSSAQFAATFAQSMAVPLRDG
jgi:hypothetical protein